MNSISSKEFIKCYKELDKKLDRGQIKESDEPQIVSDIHNIISGFANLKNDENTTVTFQGKQLRLKDLSLKEVRIFSQFTERFFDKTSIEQKSAEKLVKIAHSVEINDENSKKIFGCKDFFDIGIKIHRCTNHALYHMKLEPSTEDKENRTTAEKVNDIINSKIHQHQTKIKEVDSIVEKDKLEFKKTFKPMLITMIACSVLAVLGLTLMVVGVTTVPFGGAVLVITGGSILGIAMLVLSGIALTAELLSGSSKNESILREINSSREAQDKIEHLVKDQKPKFNDPKFLKFVEKSENEFTDKKSLGMELLEKLHNLFIIQQQYDKNRESKSKDYYQLNLARIELDLPPIE